MIKTTRPQAHNGRMLLMLAALGVVYGDIGTSPLYAMKESFFGHHRLAQTPDNVLGVLSLFFWALMLVISVKYVVLVMRADNHGEGGIFALLGLITGEQRNGNGNGKPSLHTPIIVIAILVGASLLYGDGIITPAISVLSAMEGLEVVAPGLTAWVVPLTAIILIGLFVIQKHGSQKVGGLFGPVMVVWFAALAALGVVQIVNHPIVLRAVNPMYALNFLAHHNLSSVWTLGAVVLCVTGGEALYADMGHFGRPAISRAWFYLVLPALILNYFGQGGVLLSGNPIPDNNLFYALAPSWALLPLIILATAATIIASQALISGAFSLTQQAIALGVFPRLKIVHTNPNVSGQLYVPFINWALLAGCLWLVFSFKTSSALAAAYGIAVTGTMGITTIAFARVANRQWNWRWWWFGPIVGALLVIDLVFFGANIIKFPDGGYVPIIVGAVLAVVMYTWQHGRKYLMIVYRRQLSRTDHPTISQLCERKEAAAKAGLLLNKSVVVMAARSVKSEDDQLPLVLYTHLKRWPQLPKHILFLSIIQSSGDSYVIYPNDPHPDLSKRYKVHTFQQDTDAGTIVSVQAHYGYIERIDVRELLLELKEKRLVKIPQSAAKWQVMIGIERMVQRPRRHVDYWLMGLFSILNKVAKPVTSYFGLDADVEVDAVTIDVV